VRNFEAEAVLATLEQCRVTNAVFVPTMLQTLADVPGAARRDFSALRSIAYGASPITTTVLKAALRTFRCSLFGIYGLTETTGAITQLDPADHNPDGAREGLLRSAGRPYPWVQMRIADPATGAPLPPRHVGEIWLRAPNVMRGYFNRPDETSAALSRDGWLRTGDGGYVDEAGYLFLTDRIKDMIVSGGENVYPIEVEEALSQHPDVLEVAVIGVPDERWGETVKALIVRRPGSEADADELLAFTRARLAGYKLPRSFEFVDELPRTPTGKVLKRQLRERYGAAPTAGLTRPARFPGRRT
jgi:long-chain acyl-CoA synthetase